MSHTLELIGILQKRIAEQEEKIGLLIAAVSLQNTALRGCKSSKANHADIVAEAGQGINQMLVASLSAHVEAEEKRQKKADVEAA